MNVLAIGAHPDDIEFGCAGTLLKYGQKNHSLYLLVLTEGDFGGDPTIRKQEQEAAADFLGVKELFWGGFKDTELTGDRELILKIDAVIQKVRPDIVLMNYTKDVHQDHRAVAQAGISASRYIKEVLFYEAATTQSFEPDVFVDIQDVLDKKMQLLKLHASQIDKTKVENLTILESSLSCANFRGFQGRVKFAEGFKALRVLKQII